MSTQDERRAKGVAAFNAVYGSMMTAPEEPTNDVFFELGLVPDLTFLFYFLRLRLLAENLTFNFSFCYILCSTEINWKRS